MELNIETAVRICPVNYGNSEMVCVHPDLANNTVQLANSHSYPVNYALPLDCCQSTLYQAAVAPLTNYFLEGCDVSMVTMGQSGTGKSYTLLGPGFHCASSESDHGVIPRFVRDIFTKMKQLRERSWTVHITWSQICGENIQDLLGVGSVECADITDVFQLIQVGMSNLAPKCAHTLFTLTLEQQWVVDTTVQHRVSTASFTDLAGSEKVLVYDSNGAMQTIPTDLGVQSLQRCIMSLSESCVNNINCFVPYTQSVLTTLLKDSFGGRAKTLLLCCVSPLVQDFTETLYTLQLALRAATIKNVVTINSYTTFETGNDNDDIFGLQFAANQLFKLVSNAEELFQRLVSNGTLPKTEQEQISQWLTLKQECEECISENSENPHRSLERIEEEDGSCDSTSEESTDEDLDEEEDEEEEEEEASEDVIDKVQGLMENLRLDTEKLISSATVGDLRKTDTPSVKESGNSEYHLKGARGRRVSIHSAEEFNNAQTSISVSSKISEEPPIATKLSYDAIKRNLKQTVTDLSMYQKRIVDLEETIKVKENFMETFRKRRDTKSSAHQKIEQKCQKLRKDFRATQDKLAQAQKQKNHLLESKYKEEVGTLETKLRDAESLKNITEEGRKLEELESSLHTSKKQLERLKKSKHREEERKSNYEKQLRESNKTKTTSSAASAASSKANSESKLSMALMLKSSNDSFDVNLSSEDLESLRHGIRNLRKTRDYFLDRRCKIDVKSQNKKILSELDERNLLQCEEAIEAIDLVIEYKNGIICGRQPLSEDNNRPEERGDQMLMERLLKLGENEMRILLHKYFEKVIELRCSSKKLEVQLGDVENQNESLACRVQNLSHTLQQVRLDAERRIIALQQQHEDKLHLVLTHLASSDAGDNGDRVIGRRIIGGSKRSAMTLQVAGAAASKQMDNGSLIARFTRYARQETVPRQLTAATPAAPQAKVTRQKNKLFLQQTNK